jgi:hypothetical protein
MSGGTLTAYGKYLALPIHESAVCPACGSTGVTLRADECDCHACAFRWRWPLVAMDLGLD